MKNKTFVVFATIIAIAVVLIIIFTTNSKTRNQANDIINDAIDMADGVIDGDSMEPEDAPLTRKQQRALEREQAAEQAATEVANQAADGGESNEQASSNSSSEYVDASNAESDVMDQLRAADADLVTRLEALENLTGDERPDSDVLATESCVSVLAFEQCAINNTPDANSREAIQTLYNTHVHLLNIAPANTLDATCGGLVESLSTQEPAYAQYGCSI